MTTAVNLRWLVWILLFLAIFAGFQGGRYYLANRLQELGIASALALYAMGAWRGLFALSRKEWQRWVISPLVLIGAIMGISSVVFAINYQGNVLYSFFSAREFMLAFVGPGIYLLSRCGLPVQDIQRAIWAALVALMLNYLYFYHTMDLRDAFFSSDHTVSNLVTYDEWRGFRLKPPLFAIMVGLLAAVMMLVGQPGRLHVKLGTVAVVAVAAYIWSIVQFRSTLATMLLAVVLYPLFLCHRNRVPLLLVATPLLLIVLPVVSVVALEHFLQADGGNVRARAFALAFEHMPRHVFLGAGEDSAYGQSYQDIVSPIFYPSDLGLAGTAYKYGMVGIAVYLFMHAKIWLTLWRSNLEYRDRHAQHNPLLWALLMFMTAQTFNLLLNPGLAYAQGITLGSIALGLAGLYLHPGAKTSVRICNA